MCSRARSRRAQQPANRPSPLPDTMSSLIGPTLRHKEPKADYTGYCSPDPVGSPPSSGFTRGQRRLRRRRINGSAFDLITVHCLGITQPLVDGVSTDPVEVIRSAESGTVPKTPNRISDLTSRIHGHVGRGRNRCRLLHVRYRGNGSGFLNVRHHTDRPRIRRLWCLHRCRYGLGNRYRRNGDSTGSEAATGSTVGNGSRTNPATMWWSMLPSPRTISSSVPSASVHSYVAEPSARRYRSSYRLVTWRRGHCHRLFR
jgi:hypothetical protein